MYKLSKQKPQALKGGQSPEVRVVSHILVSLNAKLLNYYQTISYNKKHVFAFEILPRKAEMLS